MCIYVFQVLQKPTGDQKPKLVMFSKKVAAAVTELIQAAEAMKGKRYFITHTFIKTKTCSLRVVWRYTVLSKVSCLSCLAQDEGEYHKMPVQNNSVFPIII